MDYYDLTSKHTTTTKKDAQSKQDFFPLLFKIQFSLGKAGLLLLMHLVLTAITVLNTFQPWTLSCDKHASVAWLDTSCNTFADNFPWQWTEGYKGGASAHVLLREVVQFDVCLIPLWKMKDARNQHCISMQALSIWGAVKRRVFFHAYKNTKCTVDATVTNEQAKNNK